MKTLVIHPDDRSTDFLKPIYNNIKEKTIVTNHTQIEKSIINMIENHDQVIMLGHGSPSGLFSISFDFNHIKTSFVVGAEHVESLREKLSNVFIWCNADIFVKNNNLKGFYSGMFISEVGEAQFCGYSNPTQEEVDESNNTFAILLGDIITEGHSAAYNYVKQTYGELAKRNRIAKYNWNRLYYNA